VDLAVEDQADSYYTGPQCQFITQSKPRVADSTAPAAAAQSGPAVTVSQSAEEDAEPEEGAAETSEAAGAYADDGTCGPDGCNGMGICKETVCYCGKFHSGEHCEVDLAHPGVKSWLAMIFYSIAGFLGLLTGYFIAMIYT
jgi:hypothetical protein